MISTYTIVLTIWMIGIAAAYLQILYWNRDCPLDYPRDYLKIGVLSLLSWLVYPISAFEWLVEHIKIK